MASPSPRFTRRNAPSDFFSSPTSTRSAGFTVTGRGSPDSKDRIDRLVDALSRQEADQGLGETDGKSSPGASAADGGGTGENGENGENAGGAGENAAGTGQSNTDPKS